MDFEELARAPGWNPLDRLGELSAERALTKAKAYSIDLLAAQTFGTEAGKKYLRQLIKQTLQRPTLSASSTLFGAGIREGQNDIVRQILCCIERAKKGPP